VITCTDLAGNVKDALLNLSIDGTHIADSIDISQTDIEFFENLVSSFEITLLSSGQAISGWGRNRVEISLDGEAYPFDIFDNGNGNYNVTMVMPDAGDYTLTVETDYGSINLNLTSKELNLGTDYLDSYISGTPETKKVMTYFSSDRTIGIASDDDIDIRDYSTSSGKLNLSSEANSNQFIFNTKSESMLSDRDSRLEKERFIALINPSFGYPINEEYILTYVLRYDEFLLSSRYNSLKQGSHKIRISMSGQNEVTIRSGSGDTQSVLTG
jgi:hypothetical protein